MLSLENWLNQQWYVKEKPNFLLKFLSVIYAFLLKFQTNQNTEKLGAPIIIVGNFTAGGTGKTPLIIALIKHLENNGFKPGVVSRGYGRLGSAPLTVKNNTHVDECGDEPLLIVQQTNAPVRVDSNRLNAAKYLIAQGCTIILADDGLQHRNLPRDIEIEVIDSQRVYGNCLLLPAGPLREPIRPVTLRVCNGCTEDRVDNYAMQLFLEHCYLLHTNDYLPLQHFSGQSVIAMAGIGNPSRFFDALSRYGIQVESRPLADHHRFKESDFPSQGNIFITEKDAVKCKQIYRNNIWVVPATAKLSDNFYSKFSRQINMLTQRNV